MWDVIQNRRVIFGEGRAALIPEIAKQLTEDTLMVLAFNERAACVHGILAALDAENIRYCFDASINGEPETTDVDRIAAIARDAKCGAVLAIGGGSVLDAAKAVALLITNAGDVADYQMNGKHAANRARPLIAVPTTSGTGSEATKVSVVYNPRNGLKKSFYSPYMIADTVVLDPALTVDLPESITVSTGVDALSHAIEAYVSQNATPFTRMYSMEAIKRARMGLEACVARPGDIEARGNMMLASFFGGMAINAGIGLAHIIAQPLGGLLRIPHGVACAIYLPYSMEYNAPRAIEDYCDIARAFEAQGETGAALAYEGIRRVKAYLKSLKAPDSISAYINPEFNLESAVKLVRGATGHIKCNPREVTEDIIREVIQKSINAPAHKEG